jgi:hypothetical protein
MPELTVCDWNYKLMGRKRVREPDHLGVRKTMPFPGCEDIGFADYLASFRSQDPNATIGLEDLPQTREFVESAQLLRPNENHIKMRFCGCLQARSALLDFFDKLWIIKTEEHHIEAGLESKLLGTRLRMKDFVRPFSRNGTEFEAGLFVRELDVQNAILRCCRPDAS